MGTGRASAFHYGETEYSMQKAVASSKGRFTYFSSKSGYNRFLEDVANEKAETENNKTYIINWKEFYVMAGSFVAKTPEDAVREFFKGLEGVSTLNQRNVKNKMLLALERSPIKSIDYNTMNLEFKVIPEAHLRGDTIIRREQTKKGEVITKIRDATRWQIEVFVRKPKRR